VDRNGNVRLEYVGCVTARAARALVDDPAVIGPAASDDPVHLFSSIDDRGRLVVYPLTGAALERDVALQRLQDDGRVGAES
jgi:hypothetical protein